MTLCDREASLEEQGTESNRFNAVFDARLGACRFLRRSLQKFSLQTAPGHRSIALLWRVRLSTTITRE